MNMKAMTKLGAMCAGTALVASVGMVGFAPVAHAATAGYTVGVVKTTVAGPAERFDLSMSTNDPAEDYVTGTCQVSVAKDGGGFSWSSGLLELDTYKGTSTTTPTLDSGLYYWAVQCNGGSSNVPFGDSGEFTIGTVVTPPPVTGCKANKVHVVNVRSGMEQCVAPAAAEHNKNLRLVYG